MDSIEEEQRTEECVCCGPQKRTEQDFTNKENIDEGSKHESNNLNYEKHPLKPTTMFYYREKLAPTDSLC